MGAVEVIRELAVIIRNLQQRPFLTAMLQLKMGGTVSGRRGAGGAGDGGLGGKRLTVGGVEVSRTLAVIFGEESMRGGGEWVVREQRGRCFVKKSPTG